MRKYYGLDVHLTEDEWIKVYGDKPRNGFKETRFKLDNILKDVDNVIKDIPYFSFYEFERIYFKIGAISDDVYKTFEYYVNLLKEEKRIGTAASYDCAMKSLKKFRKSMMFPEVNPEFLKKYEAWMLENGKSHTCIGIYLRSLRTIMNLALHHNVINNQQYPFGKWKYIIPSGRNIKKALTFDEIQKIFNHETIPGTTEDKAKDFWILSYLCNGANINDLCRLKFKNIEDNKIIFYRTKTGRTSRNPKPIVVSMTDETIKIIHKWRNIKVDPNNYVFPILSAEMDPQREKDVIHQFIKTINKYMRQIANDAGIQKNLTTYVARHSYSTILKRNGVPIAYISESLGHSDLRITESYLASFEDEQRTEFTKLLIPA